MNKDLQHLRILSICYYVFAGITAFFACIPFLHVALGIVMVTGSFTEHNKNAVDPFPPFFGWLFIGIGSLVIIFGWAIAIAAFLAGKYLKQQKNYIFCLVIAAIACLSVPIGTVLGVFTFVLLSRDSVKALFNVNLASNNHASLGSTPPDWR